MTGAEWTASVPDPFTASQGRQLLESALADAHAVVQDVTDRFHGTTPPPPWPVTPELSRAIDAADGGRLFFRRFEIDGKGATPYTRASGNGVRLLRAGQTLYTEAGKLKAASEAGADLTKLISLAIPSPAALGGAFIFGALLLVLLLVEHHERPQRAY